MSRDRRVQDTLSLSVSSCWVILVLGVLLCGTIALCSQLPTAVSDLSTDAGLTNRGSQESTAPTREKIAEAASPLTPTDKTPGSNRGSSSEEITVTGKIIEPRVNLRAMPDTKAEILSKVQEGDSITLVGQSADGQWYQAKTEGTPTGWIFGETLEITEGDSTALPVITVRP